MPKDRTGPMWRRRRRSSTGIVAVLAAWTHGTVGIADHCAPSWTGYKPFHQRYLKQWLDQGYAIVASDYQGLGTAGTHPYLATKPASYSNLDIIRAVQSADFPVSDKVVLIGQSQGAAAAFATAGYAQDYAPEIDILGVIATDIPMFTPRTIEIIQETRPNDVVDPMLGYNFLALTLVEQFNDEFTYSDFISDLAMPTAMAVDTTCHSDVRELVVENGLTYDTSFKVPPTDALKGAFAQMGYPRFYIAVPVFIGSGVNDRDTPLRMQGGLVKKACVLGTVIESHIYSGHDHLTVLNHSTVDSIPFARNLFLGQAPKSGHGGCVALISSFLEPLRSPLEALFASNAVLVLNTHVVLAHHMPLSSGLLVVHKREALIFRHT